MSTTPPTKIAAYLIERERSQTWLARKLGVTRQSVGQWCRREEKCPESRQAQIRLFLEVMPAIPLFDDNGYAIVKE